MKIRDTDYLYASMRIKALENTLLDEDTVDKLINAGDLAKTIKILEERLQVSITKKTSIAIEKSMYALLNQTITLIEEMLPNKEISNVFRVKYDYHNIKVVLKSVIADIDPLPLMIEAGRYEPARLAMSVRRQDYSEISHIAREATEKAREILARTKDAARCDLILDRAYFDEMSELAQASESEYLKGYVALSIDAANLRTAYRALKQKRTPEFLSRALFAGGRVDVPKILYAYSNALPMSTAFSGTALERACESESLSQMDRCCDNACIAYIKGAKYTAFGASPLVAFLAAREADIMAIRIIFAGKSQGMPKEKIREKLRDLYA